MFKIGYDKKITMVQGDTGVIRMRISNYELSQGDEVRFAIVNKANPSILLCQHSDKKIVLEKQVTVFEKDGSARIVIYPYDTEYLQPGKYLYEIQVKTKDSRVDTVVPLTSFTVMAGRIQGEFGQTTPSKPEPTPSEIELRFKRLENEIIPELGNRITNVENEIDSINSSLEQKANLEDINVLRPEWSSLWNEEDCSDAIEDCINRLNGGVIKFANKTYNISRPIDVKGGIRLEGTGVNSTSTNGATIIKLKDNSNCSILRTPCAKNNDGDSSAIHYFEIDHIQFDGNGQKQNIDSIGIDLQGVYIMTKLSFVSIFNNRGTALSLSYGCDLQIDHVWVLGTVITQGNRYAFEFNQKRTEAGQTGMLNINHLYVENTSNKIGGNPKVNKEDRGNAVLLNKVYTCNINELHIEGATIPVTIGDNCFSIIIRKLSVANTGNETDLENSIVLLKNNINHLKIDEIKPYNTLNSYSVKKVSGFTHNEIKDIPISSDGLSYEILGYGLPNKILPRTTFTGNIGVELQSNDAPLNITIGHKEKGISISRTSSTNPTLSVSSNINRSDYKSFIDILSYGNDADQVNINAPLKICEHASNTVNNGTVFTRSGIVNTRVNGVIQPFVTCRMYAGSPGGSGIAPQYAGQIYIDTANGKIYIAKGNSSTSDWILLN